MKSFINLLLESKENYYYHINCVDAKGDDIEEMTDIAKEISWKTLFGYVNKSDVNDIFGYDVSKDYSVSCYKSKYRGKPCFYIQHSRIEYVFLRSQDRNVC